MTIKIIQTKISLSELQALAKETFVDMVKAVADVDKNTIAVGGELHADAEAILLDSGSDQKSLWGFNIVFRDDLDSSLEYASLINIRPHDGNRSIKIQSPDIRNKILELVKTRVDWSQ